MSDASAIRAVTDRLRSVVAIPFGQNTAATALSLDKLGHPTAGAKLNVFLYQIVPSGAWANSTIPWKPGDGRVPLALDLRYLLTAVEPDPLQAQADLGLGMRILHEHPVLTPGGAAFAPFERARVTMHPLSLDDTEKLWMGVPFPRLLSVAYEVSVVLIESDEPAQMTLPVLSRGTGVPDSIEVQAGLYPTIERIEIGSTPYDIWARSRSRLSRLVAQIGDDVFLFGPGLSQFKQAEIQSLRFPDVKIPNPLTAFPAEQGAVRVQLTAASMPGFPAGLSSIRLIPERTGARYVTNWVPFALAPTINAFNPNPVAPGGTLTVTFNPPTRKGQRASLIIGGSELTLDDQDPSNSKQFVLKEVPARPNKPYPTRLRIDGVDSIPVDLVNPPGSGQRPAFSAACMVQVQ